MRSFQVGFVVRGSLHKGNTLLYTGYRVQVWFRRASRR